MMVGEFLCMYVCKCMHRWVNENVSGWGERVREWESEWVSESVSEWEGVSGLVSEGEWVRVSGPSARDQHHDLSKQVRIKQPICLDSLQTKSYASHAAEHQVLRKPAAERRRPRDARAYIRPLAEATPGRTSDPFAEHRVPRLPRKV